LTFKTDLELNGLNLAKKTGEPDIPFYPKLRGLSPILSLFDLDKKMKNKE